MTIGMLATISVSFTLTEDKSAMRHSKASKDPLPQSSCIYHTEITPFSFD